MSVVFTCLGMTLDLEEFRKQKQWFIDNCEGEESEGILGILDAITDKLEEDGHTDHLLSEEPKEYNL